MVTLGKPIPPPKMGLIFSTEVGLKTQYQNWRSSLDAQALSRRPEWIVIDWYQENGWIERLPFLPAELKVRLRSQQQLLNGLRKGPFDYLLIAAPTVAYTQGSGIGKTPYFITLDTTPQLLYRFGDLYGKYPSALGWVEALKENKRRRFFRGAQTLFAWSQWVAQSLTDDYGVDPARIQVIPPGIDLSRWPYVEHPLDGTVHLLFVGGNFERKGGDLLLAWAQQTQKTNWHLHLVTKDPVLLSHPRVTVYNDLSSNDPRLIALYQRAHAFVLPTRADCYSLAGIEAMATGLPVLLGKTGGTGEIIDHGKTGYLLEPGSLPDLTQHLEALLESPEQLAALGRAARAEAEARFDVHQNIQRILSAIEQSRAS